MKTITAIDIGTRAIKLVQMERSKGKIQVVNIGVELYPLHPRANNKPDVDNDTEHANNTNNTNNTNGAIVSCLKQLLTRLALKPKSAMVSIPRAFLTLKRLSNFPRAATDEDIAKLIPFQVEQETPLGLENSIYDYYGLRRSEAGVSVELVVARRDFVESYLKIFKAVGIKVDAIYPSTFAIYNLLLQQIEAKEEVGDKIIAIVDIGACRSELLIVRGKNLAFSTSFKWGGDDLSRLYQSKTEEGQKWGDQDPLRHLDELDSEFSSWLERLSLEVSRVFYAFSSQNLIGSERRGVDQLWLCGGCAQLKGIELYLSQLLKVETNIWNPLNLFECKSNLEELGSLEGIGGNIGVALGLGVSSLTGNIDVNVNLIPTEIKQRAAELKRKGFIGVISFLLGLLIILGVWWIRDQIKAKELAMNVLKLEVKSAQPKLQQIRSILVKDLVTQDMIVTPLSPLEVLKELSERLPDRKKVALTSFSLDRNGKIIINLEASSNSDISEVIRAINASLIFEKVEAGTISKTERDKKPILQIQLSFRLKPNVNNIKSIMTSETKQTSASEKPQTISGAGDADEKLLREQLEQKRKEMLGIK